MDFVEYTFSPRAPKRRRGRWEIAIRRVCSDGSASTLTRMTDIPAPDGRPGAGARLAERATRDWLDELTRSERDRRAALERSQDLCGLADSSREALELPLAEYGELYLSRRLRRCEIERSTAANWRADFRRYALDVLPDGVRVCDVTEDDVTEMIGAIMIDRGLSGDSARKGFLALNQVMREAIERDGLPMNPCARIKPPKANPPRKNPLSVRMASTTLQMLLGMRMTKAVFSACCALLFGICEGEITALRVKNLDLDDTGSLLIRNAIGRDGNRFYLKAPKNASRIRRIHLTPLMIELFRNRLAELEKECLREGTRLSGETFLTGRPDGTFTSPQALGKQWKALSSTLGLVGLEGKEVTFHDLRHTFATTANAAGVNIPTIAHVMGHSTTYVTSLVYISVDPEEEVGALSLLESKPGLVEVPVSEGLSLVERRQMAMRYFGLEFAA